MALFHQIRHGVEETKPARKLPPVATITSLIPAPEHQVKNRPGRKPSPSSKKLLTLRVDPDVIEAYKVTGDGWQSRMNDALRKAVGL